MRYFHPMKYFLSISFFILISIAGSAQKIKVNVQYIDKISPNESDSIFYSPLRKLMWTDYKEVNNPSYAGSAMTSANIGYTQEIKEENGQILVVIKVFAYFQKGTSWRKPTTSGSLALNHEQRHFDLAYLGALRFVDYLKKAKFKEKNYKTLANTTYFQVFKENQAVQQGYDKATEHGNNVQTQLEWNKNIDEMIEKQFSQEN